MNDFMQRNSWWVGPVAIVVLMMLAFVARNG